LFGHNGKWLRVKGKISLNKAYYLFVDIVYHTQVTPGPAINLVLILGTKSLTGISDHNCVVKRDVYP
jgi:hypothetical protein